MTRSQYSWLFMTYCYRYIPWAPEPFSWAIFLTFLDIPTYPLSTIRSQFWRKRCSSGPLSIISVSSVLFLTPSYAIFSINMVISGFFQEHTESILCLGHFQEQIPWNFIHNIYVARHSVLLCHGEIRKKFASVRSDASIIHLGGKPFIDPYISISIQILIIF